MPSATTSLYLSVNPEDHSLISDPYQDPNRVLALERTVATQGKYVSVLRLARITGIGRAPEVL